jgi:mRNA interferase MazF
MIRGEIWWANLPDSDSSIPAKRRPVLIIQSDGFNRSKINTIICVAITSNTDLAFLPGNLLLEKAVSGLGKTSVINFSQIATVDRYDLKDYVAMLPKPIMEKVNNCLKTVLEII